MGEKPCELMLLALAAAGAVLPVPAADRGERCAFDERIGREMLPLINHERQSQGLPALASDPVLEALARRHSRGLAVKGKLKHSPDRWRIRKLSQAGLYFYQIAENVARSRSAATLLIHRALMSSPAHRRNILDPHLNSVGIGVATRENVYYVAQEFATQVVPESEVRERIEDEIGLWQRENGSGQLHGDDYLQKSARLFSESFFWDTTSWKKNKHLLKPFQTIRCRVHKIQFPVIDKILDAIRQALGKGSYKRYGLGVVWGRCPDYPGGTWHVLLMLE